MVKKRVWGGRGIYSVGDCFVTTQKDSNAFRLSVSARNTQENLVDRTQIFLLLIKILSLPPFSQSATGNLKHRERNDLPKIT